MTNADLADEIERLHLAFEEAKKGSIEDRAIPVAKLQAALMVNRDQIIAALHQSSDKVLVPIATLDRIMRDCEHGSRIWQECDALLREYALAAAEAEGHHE